MVDGKIRTLLKLVETGSFTRAAEGLSLTQPAVSHHIKLLEEEFGIKIFHRDKKALRLTPEGEILVKYARRVVALYDNCRRAILDSRREMKHLAIGITQTASENLMPQVIATYCNEHPSTHIQVVIDSINNLSKRMKAFELDIAIVEGTLLDDSYTSVLLDTDYLCLIVSPRHPFAKRPSVSTSELPGEKFILRPADAGTRVLFDQYLHSQSQTIQNLNVILEMDNVAVIKELVALNLGISIIAHSACREELQAGKLAVVPIENANMIREINMVHHRDFDHPEILEEFRRIYSRTF